jgi:hypothetical protein
VNIEAASNRLCRGTTLASHEGAYSCCYDCEAQLPLGPGLLQITLSMRRRRGFAYSQQAIDTTHRACASKLFVRGSMPMVRRLSFGRGTACRSRAAVQPIPSSIMNAAPDLCCDKYRPACSDNCSLSIDFYTATQEICLSAGRSASAPKANSRTQLESSSKSFSTFGRSYATWHLIFSLLAGKSWTLRALPQA